MKLNLKVTKTDGTTIEVIKDHVYTEHDFRLAVENISNAVFPKENLGYKLPTFEPNLSGSDGVGFIHLNEYVNIGSDSIRLWDDHDYSTNKMTRI